MRRGGGMIYLSVLTRRIRMAGFGHPRFGVMVTPKSTSLIPRGMIWAADNGCYAQGDRFRLDHYLTWLSKPVGELSRCLFATAPDVVGDAEATWARAAAVLPLLRDLGYRSALVAQDGFDPDVIDWAAFDALFIGGSTAWKRSEAGGYAAIRVGKQLGKTVHVGRVNGGPFFRSCAAAGADSADGTMLAFGPDKHWPLVVRWLDGVASQPTMHLEAV